MYFILTPSVKFQQDLWSSFTNTQRPQLRILGHPICSVGCADGHTGRRTSEWQGEWQITEKLLYLRNMMVGKLNYELPIALVASLYRKNRAIASQFNLFLRISLNVFGDFLGLAEHMRSSYWPGCKTSVVCEFVLTSELVRRMNVGANFHP